MFKKWKTCNWAMREKANLRASKIYPASAKVVIKQFFLPCLSCIDFKTRCIMKHILNTEPDGYEKKSTDVKNHGKYYEFCAQN